MKKRFICVFLIACILICSLFAGCEQTSQKNKYSTNSFDYFDTITTITGFETSQKAFDAVCEDIFSQLSKYHKLYNIYESFENTKNLYTVNELVNGSHQTITVDKSIIDMLLYSKEMYIKTDGMLNIAMGSVLSLWHEYRETGNKTPEKAMLPPKELLNDASKHTDISKLIINEKENTVYIADGDMRLDVGSIAKGYATEQVALYLEEKGITGYVLNIGGNVRTIGPKPNGDAWTIGIENASNTDDFLAYLELNGQSVVTSGSYQRYYTVDGKRYHHIINPKTQMPAEYFLSISVICSNSALGDALSTALFCMPIEKGKALVETMPEVEVLWVEENGKQTKTSGFENYIKK